MKLIEMCTSVDKQGCLVLPKGPLGNAGLKPGDEVCVTLITGKEESETGKPLLIVSPRGAGVAVQLS